MFDRNGNGIADWLEEETDDEWVYSGSGWDHVSTLEDGVYGPTASQIRALYDEYARISGNKSELYTAQGIPKVDMFDELTETIVQRPENKKGAVEIASSNNAVLNDEHRDYLERVADSNTPAAYWAQQQLVERRYFIDPDEPDVVYSLDEVDGGVKYDYIPEAVAVTVIASCIVSCGTVVTAVSDAMDVGTMGTTVATTTVVVGGKVSGAILRVFGKGKAASEFAPELLKTEKNTAFFWSGRTGGIGGAERALEIAKKKGGTTLEGLIESKRIKMPEWDINNPASIKAWEDVSAAYANQVSGEVRAVVGSNLRQGNIWENVELPRLMDNPNVTKITTIDPKTLVEKIIFER